MQYLFNQLHFKATFLTGKTIKGRRDKHAINMIKYDNDYYYVDATWGDLVNNEFETINYDYLMFSSEEMNKNYQIQDSYEDTTNGNNTYYKKEGYYFDYYRIDDLKQKINLSQNECHFQFSSEIYEYAKNRLVSQGDVYKIIDVSNDREIKYIDDERFHTIYLRW